MPEQPAENQQQAINRAIAVKQKYQIALLGKKNVIGVGVGIKQMGGMLTESVAVVVNVRQKEPPWALSRDDLLPTMLDGVPVDVVETGLIQAQG